MHGTICESRTVPTVDAQVVPFRAHLRRSRCLRWCQGQRTGSRAVSRSDSRRCCRNAYFILRIPHCTNQHGKAGSMRVVGNPRYEVCLGHPVHSFCLQLARTQRRLLVERKQQKLLRLPGATAVGRPGRCSCWGNCLGMSYIQSAVTLPRSAGFSGPPSPENALSPSLALGLKRFAGAHGGRW